MICFTSAVCRTFDWIIVSNNRQRQNGTTDDQSVERIDSGIVTNGERVEQTDTKPTAVLFGEPTISLPKNPSVNDKYGRTSTACANVSVPLPGIGASLESAIYATIVTKDGERVIDYSVYVPTKAISFGSPEDKQRFTDHVDVAVASWAGWVRAEALASQRLSDHVSGIKRSSGNIPADAPRLVSKRMGIVPGANMVGPQTVRSATAGA